MSDVLKRYQAALHAMQTAVKLLMTREDPESDVFGIAKTGECAPKHLRVGVNSALASAEGIGQLLVRKGVITDAELQEAITAAVEDRVRQYRALLNLPPNVHLA